MEKNESQWIKKKKLKIKFFYYFSSFGEYIFLLSKAYYVVYTNKFQHFSFKLFVFLKEQT